MNARPGPWRRCVAAQFQPSAAVDRWLAPPRTAATPSPISGGVSSPRCCARGTTVYDAGGGRSPFLSAQTKSELALHVIGLDIDARELAAVPAWGYDATVHADLTVYRAAGDGDPAICQTVPEHVASTPAALTGLAILLRPGGRAALFVPSATAAFARLNRLLPARMKRRLLDAGWPDDHDGFPARYDS